MKRAVFSYMSSGKDISMSGRFLLESLLMCALVWGGFYLVLGSMHSVEGTLITLGNFFAQSGEALIRSPE
jgi:hypothetical protein